MDVARGAGSGAGSGRRFWFERETVARLHHTEETLGLARHLGGILAAGELLALARAEVKLEHVERAVPRDGLQRGGVEGVLEQTTGVGFVLELAREPSEVTVIVETLLHASPAEPGGGWGESGGGKGRQRRAKGAAFESRRFSGGTRLGARSISRTRF